ncbi:hypothetical protein MA16_Dca022880 [Dendrobium catenatum]|uniref:Uncharacterized protein n=1 Tax=Dendrobium catenatum TaxID=906689 RepID=A0A2I0WCC2_9ASPA|nr:hypothetical protein MA16_Dca022880 [Dendrobium catenatum]
MTVTVVATTYGRRNSTGESSEYSRLLDDHQSTHPGISLFRSNGPFVIREPSSPYLKIFPVVPGKGKNTTVNIEVILKNPHSGASSLSGINILANIFGGPNSKNDVAVNKNSPLKIGLTSTIHRIDSEDNIMLVPPNMGEVMKKNVMEEKTSTNSWVKK